MSSCSSLFLVLIVINVVVVIGRQLDCIGVNVHWYWLLRRGTRFEIEGVVFVLLLIGGRSWRWRRVQTSLGRQLD
jgi:hypothetical protein